MNFRKSVVTSLGFLTLALSLWACGGSDSANTSAATANSCTAGTVFYANTCIPQGSCQVGYGIYNGQCVAGTVANTGVTGNCTAGLVQTQYGCLAQASCPVGQALYNTTCIPAVQSQYTTQYPYSGQTQPYPYAQGYPYQQQTGAAVGVGIGGVGIGFNVGYGQQNTCGYGATRTVYGCLPQGPCVAGYGYGNGLCYKGM